MRTLLTGALVAAGAITISGAAAPSAAQADDTPWTLPETPPRCTTAQATSGDVADCLLAFYQDPADTGWGVPPAPGVGPGWEWKGYTYNDSPALAAWEAAQIAANTAPVAGKHAGYLETHHAARTLFEGFLDEISARGYDVHAVTGYSFRCTSGNGGWSCPSGDIDDLSYHAWGLAIDMNAGTNPIRSYSGVDGRTACLTPMQTDMPRWVIQTAEKWGLYWGGYGWNSGCQSTSTERSIVYRDPPHFEFRGTPEQAAAIAGFNLRNHPSAVCFDVVLDDGEVGERCTLDGVPQTGWRLPVRLDAPDDAVAALVNLTGTGAAAPGSFTVEDCGPRRSGPRGTTSLQFTPGSAIATMTVAPLADDDRFCIWRSAPAHSIVDVIGYLTASGERVWVDPVVPSRLTDTRAQATCTPEQECLDGPVEHEGIRHVPTADTAPRLANVTTTRSDGWGWLQAGRCDDVGPGRTFSNLNYVDRGARANLVLMEGGDAGTCTYNWTGTHVIVDELARLDATEGYG
ncbi:MAG: M15 family metallopeptidase, partial [Acidimicrobiia bacterium]